MLLNRNRLALTSRAEVPPEGVPGDVDDEVLEPGAKPEDEGGGEKAVPDLLKEQDVDGGEVGLDAQVSLVPDVVVAGLSVQGAQVLEVFLAPSEQGDRRYAQTQKKEQISPYYVLVQHQDVLVLVLVPLEDLQEPPQPVVDEAHVLKLAQEVQPEQDVGRHHRELLLPPLLPRSVIVVVVVKVHPGEVGLLDPRAVAQGHPQGLSGQVGGQQHHGERGHGRAQHEEVEALEEEVASLVRAGQVARDEGRGGQQARVGEQVAQQVRGGRAAVRVLPQAHRHVRGGRDQIIFAKLREGGKARQLNQRTVWPDLSFSQLICAIICQLAQKCANLRKSSLFALFLNTFFPRKKIPCSAHRKML